jgi:16S rRNA (cytosine967-C5)-methyltransferase
MTATTASGVESRAAAYRAIRRVHARDAWSAAAVDRELRRAGLDARDRAYAASLAYETLRWEGTLDWALAQVLTRPLEAVSPEVLDVLRLGAWQLLYGRVPDRAAVSTAVELARTTVGSRATGFVNGVLRALARRCESLPWPSPEDERGLGLLTGYPAWAAAAARQRFGERARAVLDAGNTAPGLTLRAVGERDALLDELRRAGYEPRPGVLASGAVRLPGADPAALPAVQEGRAVPQDEASQLVVSALAALVGRGRGLSGQRVADLCAAPGGKATHLAQLGAFVVAIDLRPSRSRLLVEAAARVRAAGSIRVVVADAAAPPLREAAFDGVLLDAPCTGLGVVRRRPELRWRRTADNPARLGVLQLRLLEAAARLLRPGGVLVYSVCTWTREETIDVAMAFHAAAGDRYTALDAAAATGAGTVLPGDHGVQLAPDTDDVDGMYVACFRRMP